MTRARGIVKGRKYCCAKLCGHKFGFLACSPARQIRLCFTRLVRLLLTLLLGQRLFFYNLNFTSFFNAHMSGWGACSIFYFSPGPLRVSGNKRKKGEREN